MTWEGEKNFINPSNTEIIEGIQKNNPSFEDKISNQLARFSPELKNKAIQFISQHQNAIKNEKLFIRNLATTLQNKTEDEVFVLIEKLVEQEVQKTKNEIKETEERKDISKQPNISAFLNISQETQSTTQETQSTTQETQSTTQETQSTINEDKEESLKTKIQQAKIDTQQEQIKILEEQTQAAQKALNPRYTKHTETELQAKTSTLSPQIKSKLENANIKFEDYASFLLSREKIGNDTSTPENETFLKSLKNLEHSLWIPESSRGGFFRSFEPQNETFVQNPDLSKYANESQDFSAFEKLNYFPENMPLEEEKKLIQSFASPALKEFFQAITPLFTKEQNLLSEVEKQALKNYQKQVDQLKYQIESKAKNFMKAGATNAPITAILKYLDSESLGGQTLTDLLEKPKSWSFAEIHQEGKDQVLHFQGKIDGNPLTFYYNLSDTNASLECDDCLYQDPVSKSFTLGKSTGARTKLNIQMPTTEQLASNLSNACSPEQFQKILKNSSTPAEYQQQLSQLISWTIEKSFADEKLIKSRLARHTEKNLTIQTLNSSLIPNEIMEQLTSWKKLNENQDTKRLFKLLDRTTESSTSSELQSFRSALKKRDTLLQSPERIQNIQDPVLRSCLENCATAKIKKSDFPAWNEALLQLFDLFTKQSIWSEASNTDDPNYVLNLSDFSHFVDYLEKPEKKITDDQQLSSFSPDFQRKYEAQKEKSDLQEDKTLASLEEQMKESFEFAYA